MNDPEFDPQEQDMINRLTNAPQPTLKPDAFEAIRARMLDAMDMPLQTLKPARRLGSRPPVIAAVVVTILLASSIAILTSNNSSTTPEPTTAPTLVPTIPTLVPTVPLVPTYTILPPTEVPTSVIVTEAPLPTSTVDSTPEITATLEPVIVVEGPVESIADNVITIYGIDITLNPDDPMLTAIQVGDVLHVEADYATDTTTIVAVTVEPVIPTPVNNDVNVNPATGESWRDDGSCAHPPPDWAPANGWRRRCGAAPANNNPPGNGNGGGNGNGNGGGNGNGNGGGNGNGNGKGMGNG